MAMKWITNALKILSLAALIYMSLTVVATSYIVAQTDVSTLIKDCQGVVTISIHSGVTGHSSTVSCAYKN